MWNSRSTLGRIDFYHIPCVLDTSTPTTLDPSMQPKLRDTVHDRYHGIAADRLLLHGHLGLRHILFR